MKVQKHSAVASGQLGWIVMMIYVMPVPVLIEQRGRKIWNGRHYLSLPPFTCLLTFYAKPPLSVPFALPLEALLIDKKIRRRTLATTDSGGTGELPANDYSKFAH
ncbi:hypothetical protein KZ483_27265 [Paenibacillus sp. sptzw28]|uniref:hypothetical protein n=1 Tax=Paenibacillus sp. sptzw28 TaxID=715179 RepID=UPI001C6E076C|nr:hypothetical protein [Paenibacillus sp. sptzw28]QYR21330.1 hypothetical protein KZ483_27265 [Paenibacillus sp. sptzw28]